MISFFLSQGAWVSAKDRYEKILLLVSESKLVKENSCQTGMPRKKTIAGNSRKGSDTAAPVPNPMRQSRSL